LPTTGLKSAAVVVAAFVLGAIPLTAQVVDTVAAVASLSELRQACDRVEPLWPVPLCGPILLVHPATRVAVANVPWPNGTPVEGAWVGRLPDEVPVANTAIDWEGERWAMVMLPLPEDRFDRLRLLAHESFHRIQPELGHDGADAMATHLDEEDARVWLRLELRALARAVKATGRESREAAVHALMFRSIRQGLYPGAAELEATLEANEGLAEYTGVRFALDATGADRERAATLIERFEGRTTYVRSLGYGTGPALGLLLDRFAPGWRGAGPAAAADPARLLSETLGQVLGDGEYAFSEIASEEAARAARTAELRERYRRQLIEGPVLVLELPNRRVMFNPNTVVALGDDGNIYPGATLLGPWGQLTVHDGAALISHARDTARVAAPDDAMPDDDGILQGPGWTLELEPGWQLSPGLREGDLRVVRTGGPRDGQ
jgi:hypothetical protein